MSVSFSDIEEASGRLNGNAHRTPVMTSRTCDGRVGAKVFFKCENFQRGGAFKFRGAFNAMVQLDDAAKARGVITHSSGNHAGALALVGKLLGIAVTVVMPDDSPRVKRDATAGYGADIVLYDKNVTTREELSRSIASERGLTLIPPYDHPHIIAGQGTAAKELIEEVGPLDFVITPCGGGGLLSGCAVATKHLLPSAKVVGAEPANADDATRSFETKTLQKVHNPDTIADGARTPSLGSHTFPLVLEYVDQMATVSEDAILEATLFLWQRMKLYVEPTGALGLGALLSGRVDVRGARVGVVLSGGNVDLDVVLPLLSQIH